MKFKGQWKINICGFEYKKILQTAVGGGSEHPPKKPRLRMVPIDYAQNVRYSISITGKMTGKSYGPTEMIIRGLPVWLAWFAVG